MAGWWRSPLLYTLHFNIPWSEAFIMWAKGPIFLRFLTVLNDNVLPTQILPWCSHAIPGRTDFWSQLDRPDRWEKSLSRTDKRSFGTPGSRPVSLGDMKEMEITELHNYTKGMPMSQKSQPELKGENGNKQHNFQTSSLNRNSGAEPF